MEELDISRVFNDAEGLLAPKVGVGAPWGEAMVEMKGLEYEGDVSAKAPGFSKGLDVMPAVLKVPGKSRKVAGRWRVEGEGRREGVKHSLKNSSKEKMCQGRAERGVRRVIHLLVNVH